MIIPLSTTYNSTTIVYSNERSYVDRCFEDSANADILAKNLLGEQLTDEEATRIARCVAEKKKASGELTLSFCLGIILFLVIVIVALVCAYF